MIPSVEKAAQFFEIKEPTPLQRIDNELTRKAGIELFIKREDRVHEVVSGNKFRKLKYNILEAIDQRYSRLVTFGGAYSNHIYATAYLAEELGFQAIGVIRGDELDADNPTLAYVRNVGMYLEFISREQYRDKNHPVFIEALKNKFGDFYLIPEGGSNSFAIKGIAELAQEINTQLPQCHYLCVASGTGGTTAGLISGIHENTRVIGFPVLKGGEYLAEEISQWIHPGKDNWALISDYHFGGYARIDKTLIEFMEEFEVEYNIPLDPVYTAKLLYGVFDQIKKGNFPRRSRIVVLHSGGLQGRVGMQQKIDKVLEGA